MLWLIFALCVVAHNAVVRTVELPGTGSPVVRESILLTLAQQKPFDLAVPDARAPFLTAVAADGAEVSFGKGKLRVLPHKTTVVIRCEYVGLLAPLPTEVPQGQPQFHEYRDIDGIGAPFEVSSFKLTVKLPSKEAEFNATLASLSGNALVFKEANYDPARVTIVRYASGTLGLVARHWTRQVWVRGHGRSVEFDEHVSLEHTGARIKGFFSRFQHMVQSYQRKHGNAILSIAVPLPKSAESVFLKDEVGNLSTSAIVHKPKEKILQVTPRYPLYGGWNASWNHGYEVPGSTMFDGKTLRVALGSTIAKVVIQKYVVEVYLPEGAKIGEVVLDGDTQVVLTAGSGENTYSVRTKKYYLDTVGRPVVVVALNWFYGRKVNLHVSFTIDPVVALFKPVLVGVAALVAVGAFANWSLKSTRKCHQ